MLSVFLRWQEGKESAEGKTMWKKESQGVIYPERICPTLLTKGFKVYLQTSIQGEGNKELQELKTSSIRAIITSKRWGKRKVTRTQTKEESMSRPPREVRILVEEHSLCRKVSRWMISLTSFSFSDLQLSVGQTLLKLQGMGTLLK